MAENIRKNIGIEWEDYPDGPATQLINFAKDKISTKGLSEFCGNNAKLYYKSYTCLNLYSNGNWAKPSIMFSTSDVPGESERYIAIEDNTKTTHVVMTEVKCKFSTLANGLKNIQITQPPIFKKFLPSRLNSLITLFNSIKADKTKPDEITFYVLSLFGSTLDFTDAEYKTFFVDFLKSKMIKFKKDAGVENAWIGIFVPEHYQFGDITKPILPGKLTYDVFNTAYEETKPTSGEVHGIDLEVMFSNPESLYNSTETQKWLIPGINLKNYTVLATITKEGITTNNQLVEDLPEPLADSKSHQIGSFGPNGLQMINFVDLPDLH